MPHYFTRLWDRLRVLWTSCNGLMSFPRVMHTMPCLRWIEVSGKWAQAVVYNFLVSTTLSDASDYQPESAVRSAHIDSIEAVVYLASQVWFCSVKSTLSRKTHVVFYLNLTHNIFDAESATLAIYFSVKLKLSGCDDSAFLLDTTDYCFYYSCLVTYNHMLLIPYRERGRHAGQLTFKTSNAIQSAIQRLTSNFYSHNY
jgi:hypothetical protein